MVEGGHIGHVARNDYCLGIVGCTIVPFYKVMSRSGHSTQLHGCAIGELSVSCSQSHGLIVGKNREGIVVGGIIVEGYMGLDGKGVVYWVGQRDCVDNVQGDGVVQCQPGGVMQSQINGGMDYVPCGVADDDGVMQVDDAL